MITCSSNKERYALKEQSMSLSSMLYHIHQLCDDYEHARHHYESFDDTKFKVSIKKCLN